MEHFVILVNGWKPLTIITKGSILDVAAVLAASDYGRQPDLTGKLPRLLGQVTNLCAQSEIKLSARLD